MCSMCMHTPCNSRCPNAPEEEAITECFVCGKAITAGKMIYEINDTSICESCARSMTIEELEDVSGMSRHDILLAIGGEYKRAEDYRLA